MRPYIDLPAPTPESTLVEMRRLAQEAQWDPALRELANEITRGVWPNDYISEYAALLNWVRRNIRYTRDPATMEQVQSPRATLELRSGDCDDYAVLLAALVGVIGGQSRFVAGAFRRGSSGAPVLSHVWCSALDPTSGAWVALDPVPGRRVNQMLGSTLERLTARGVD